MMFKQNQVLILLVLTVTFVHGVFSTQAPCPGGVATLNTEYTITGDTSSYTGFVWIRPSEGRYVVTCNTACSPVEGYNATNDTLSTLTIKSVRMIDAGTWKIVDANVVDAIPVDVCHLTAASPPQCSISSDTDTDALEPGTNITLTVDIRSYYCSQHAGFDLTTGSVTDVLFQNQTTHNMTDTVQYHFFNVSSDRFGNVSVMFRCDNSNISLTCDGVSKLSAAPSPTTSPTSSGSTSSDTAITSSSSRISSSTTPRSTAVVEGGVSPGVIAGIVISIVFVLAIMVILILLYCKQCRTRRKYILEKVGDLCCCRK